MINYDEIMSRIVTVNKKKEMGTNTKEYLKTDVIGNTITGRFLPNIKDIDNSVINYFHHGWQSKLDSSGVFQLCPSGYKEKCPTCSVSIKAWKGEDPVAKDESKKIRRRQNWLVNFYVINDAKHPENNGLVKILRYGFQIKAKYDLATTGDDSEIYGPKIWRLDEEGCNFRIKCEQNSESKEAWPTYTNSSFLPPSKLDDMTDEKIDEILNSVFDLTTLFERKSYEVLQEELNKHYMLIDTESVSETTTSESPEQTLLTLSDVPADAPTTKTEDVDKGDASPNTPKSSTSDAGETPTNEVNIANEVNTGGEDEVSSTEDELDKMLKDLQG